MTNSLDEPGELTAEDPVPKEPTWTPERRARHRRNMLFQLGLVGVVLLVGGFGLLHHNYPIYHARSGGSYPIIALGHRQSADWRGTVVQFLSQASDSAALEREVTDIAEMAQNVAAFSGDTTLDVVATSRRFSYGLFFIDEFHHFRFHRARSGWIRD